MSDRMSNVEIEDVISSIRKLVSEDEVEETPSVTEEERLVLTEEQLIEEKAEAEGGPLQLGDALSETVAPEIAELKSRIFEETEDTVEEAVQSEEDFDDWEHTDDLPTEIFQQADDDVFDTDLAEVEEQAPPKAEVLMFRTAVRGNKAELPAERPSENSAEEDGDDAGEKVDDTPERIQPRAVRSKIKAAEEVLIEAAVELEIENSSSDEDESAASVSSEEDDFAPEWPSVIDDSSLDEEKIRAIVSEIIRQELKGPMGERITRNVRRLVRREIAQFLAEKEAE